jgi:hypothetical protein
MKASERSGAMTETQTRVESKAIAKVSKKPELAATASGFPVCRLTVVTDEAPGMRPVKVPVFVAGWPGEAQRKLALRCGELRVGELVQATGILRQRVRRTKRGKDWIETALQALDVQVLGDDGRPVQRDPREREGLLQGLVVNCMASPYEVYIGRGKDPFTQERPEFDWGNRFSHRDSKFEIVRVDTAEEAVALHRVETWEQIKRGELSLERVAELAGKTLGCYCKPGCCHGDTLAKASIWAVEELARRRAGC